MTVTVAVAMAMGITHRYDLRCIVHLATTLTLTTCRDWGIPETWYISAMEVIHGSYRCALRRSCTKKGSVVRRSYLGDSPICLSGWKNHGAVIGVT